MNFWGKRIKSTKDISKRTGIDEQKIKELKEGKREIGGETMEKVLGAIEKSEKETKIEKQVREKEIYDWCINTDIMELIKEFGYSGQTEIAPYIGVNQSFISNLINKKLQGYTNNMGKLYDFFHDDFNKKAKTVDNTNIKIDAVQTISGTRKKDDKIVKWFEKADLKKLVAKLGYRNQEDCAKDIGVPTPTFNDWTRKRCKPRRATMELLYNFFHQKLNEQKENLEIINDSNIETDDVIQFFAENKIGDIRNKLNTTDFGLADIAGVSKSSLLNMFNGKLKKVTQAMVKAYENLTKELNKIDNNEKQTKTPEIRIKDKDNTNTLDETKTEPNEAKNDEIGGIKEEQPTTETNQTKKSKVSRKELKRRNKLLIHNLGNMANVNFDLLQQIEKKDRRIEKLEKQIYRYEKLIDNLK